MVEKIKIYFDFKAEGTNFSIETVGGVTTFMTMAYIIFVNPSILSAAGMDFDSVMTATCLASALATVIMALWARYPIALAPGMGLNAFFAFEIVKGYGVPWQTALGMVFIAGCLFLLLTALKFRQMLINAVPDTLKFSIAAGIGLFIAFIGLQHAGLVITDPATLVRMGDLSSPTVMISMAGLAATALMFAARIRGAVLWGIFVAGGLGIVFGEIRPEGFGWDSFISLTPTLSLTAFKLDVGSVFSHWKWIALTLALLFFDLFDTVGTLIGVSGQAGFLKDGKLPRATRALSADAVGTVAGSLLGTSTVTSYIESATGVAAGARTGFASLVTASLFLVAIFFSPLVSLFAKDFVTAPALIAVGALMMAGVAKVKWDDYAEAIPAFLTMILMPLTFSVSKGLVAGLISWPLLQIAAGRGRDVHPFAYGLAAALLIAVVVSSVVM